MLHISDVETRLRNCPEPIEVREMRHKVIESFSDLEFFEGPHEYIRHKPDGDIKLPSVTGVVQRFEPHVDWDVACVNKATKLGIDPAVLKRQWTENNITSTSNGSKTHLFGESCLYFMRNRLDLIDQEVAHYQLEKDYLIPYGKKEIAASKLYEDILTNYNVFPVMAEAKVYTGKNDTLKLKDDYCGTFDILWAYRDKQGVIQPLLMDWKTNKSLYKDYNRQNGIMMLPPFDDFVDEPLSHYIVQLSMYSMAMEQIGIVPKNRIIIWLKDDGTYEKIPVPYVGDRLRKVL